MRKFNTVLKEKQTKEEQLSEKKVLGQFKRVYDALLERYSVTEFGVLSEKAQNVFLSELNAYWSEAEGVSEMGVKFLSTRGRSLNEHSSTEQKKNFLHEKTNIVISEMIRQSELKNKIYGVIDEMYNEVKATALPDVLPANVIFETVKEAFVKSVKTLLTEINYEIKESSK
jgi:hypothetical protein